MFVWVSNLFTSKTIIISAALAYYGAYIASAKA